MTVQFVQRRLRFTILEAASHCWLMFTLWFAISPDAVLQCCCLARHCLFGICTFNFSLMGVGLGMSPFTLILLILGYLSNPSRALLFLILSSKMLVPALILVPSAHFMCILFHHSSHLWIYWKELGTGQVLASPTWNVLLVWQWTINKLFSSWPSKYIRSWCTVQPLPPFSISSGLFFLKKPGLLITICQSHLLMLIKSPFGLSSLTWTYFPIFLAFVHKCLRCSAHCPIILSYLYFDSISFQCHLPNTNSTSFTLICLLVGFISFSSGKFIPG